MKWEFQILPITEWLELEGTFGDHLAQTPCQGKDHLEQVT